MASEEERWPETVDEAVDQLLSLLTDEDRETIKTTPDHELIRFHLGLGMAIRNRFGLWRGNTALLQSCGREDMHPDDASSVIIRALWKRLCGETP